jgi:YD repeat-containing protein
VKKALAAGLLFAGAWALPAADPTPTFCAEWVEQTRDGYERLTLFSDRNVVWKRSLAGAEQLKRRRLGEEEAKFYCDYFRSEEIWSGAEDLRSGMTGDLIKQSVVTLTRPDGSRHQVRFDELSALTTETAALRSSLEGLRATFSAPLAPASRFTPENIPPGTVLRRFDGVLFRVKRLDVGKGIVELEGFRDPYSEFRRIEDLRFLFHPPESR